MANNFTKRYDDLRDSFDNANAVGLSTLTDIELKRMFEEAKESLSEYDNMQLTVKLDGNSLYGVSASQYYSLVDYDIAEDITGSARHFAILIDIAINKFFSHWADEPYKQANIERVRKFYPNIADIENFKNYKRDTVNDLCVYGDTDSRYVDISMIHDLLYLNTPDGVRQAQWPDTSEEGNALVARFGEFLAENYINEIIAKSLKRDIELRGANSGFLRMAHEVTSNGQAVFITRKKYILPLVWKDGKMLKQPKMKLQGVELKRGEMSKRVKAIIEKLVKKFVLEGFNVEQIRGEILKLYKYIKMRRDMELIFRITAVTMDGITFDEKQDKYVTSKSHIQSKIALSWCNFIHENNLESRFKQPFARQKMLYYYTKKGDVMGIPDDVDIAEVPGLPEPDWDKMIKQTLVKSIMRYIYEDNNFEDVDITNFLLGVKRLSLTTLGKS